MTLTHTRPREIRPVIQTGRESGLTMKDAIAGLLVAAGAVATFAAGGDWGWPMLGSIRSAAAVVGLLGAAACGVGSKIDPEGFKTTYGKVASAVGSIALVLVVLTLVTGSEGMLFALAGVTVLLWMMATIRHAVEK